MSIDRIIQGAIAVATLLAVVYSCQSGRKADKANKISEKANQIADKALYTAELSPFDPTFVASDPIWKVEEVDRNKKVKLALVLTIIVSNNGAQPGCIEDLVAALELPVTADQRKLRAHYFVNSEKLLEVLRQGKRARIYEAHEAPFAPIVVLGKQQVVKTVVFRHPNLGQKDLHEGKYVLRLIGSDCRTPETWDPFWKSTYLMTESQVRDLLCGQTTVFESEEHIAAVRALKVP